MENPRAATAEDTTDPAFGFGEVLFDELMQIAIRRGVLARLTLAKKQLSKANPAVHVGVGAPDPMPRTTLQPGGCHRPLARLSDNSTSPPNRACTPHGKSDLTNLTIRQLSPRSPSCCLALPSRYAS